MSAIHTLTYLAISDPIYTVPFKNGTVTVQKPNCDSTKFVCFVAGPKTIPDSRKKFSLLKSASVNERAGHTFCHGSKLAQISVNSVLSSGVLWPMNSRGGQKEKISNKIYLIYLDEIEAFHVSIMGGGRKIYNLCLY